MTTVAVSPVAQGVAAALVSDGENVGVEVGHERVVEEEGSGE